MSIYDIKMEAGHVGMAFRCGAIFGCEKCGRALTRSHSRHFAWLSI